MGFRNFGETQLAKYSANFNWEGAVQWPLWGLVNALLSCHCATAIYLVIWWFIIFLVAQDLCWFFRVDFNYYYFKIQITLDALTFQLSLCNQNHRSRTREFRKVEHPRDCIRKNWHAQKQHALIRSTVQGQYYNEILVILKALLTRFIPPVSFYTPGFPMVLGGTERSQWHEMG